MNNSATVIDSHHHFWDVGKLDYPWMPPGESVLRRNYLPEDLAPALAQAGVNKTVIVQAHQSIEETMWLLDIAENTEFVAGVVGWVDLTAPDVGNTLDELQANPWFKGVRHIWHDEPDDDWLARPGPVNGLREIAARGLAYDFLVRPQHLKYVPEIMEKVPDLRSVIDHIAKPLIAEKVIEPWLEDLREVANIPGMMCKVSGMVTEADMDNWSADDLAPYVAHVLGMFGYDRLMYGSDWPVCLQAGSYQQVFGAAKKTLSSLTSEESEAVFGKNAARFYRLD